MEHRTLVWTIIPHLHAKFQRCSQKYFGNINISHENDRDDNDDDDDDNNNNKIVVESIAYQM